MGQQKLAYMRNVRKIECQSSSAESNYEQVMFREAEKVLELIQKLENDFSHGANVCKVERENLAEILSDVATKHIGTSACSSAPIAEVPGRKRVRNKCIVSNEKEPENTDD